MFFSSICEALGSTPSTTIFFSLQLAPFIVLKRSAFFRKLTGEKPEELITGCPRTSGSFHNSSLVGQHREQYSNFQLNNTNITSFRDRDRFKKIKPMFQ